MTRMTRRAGESDFEDDGLLYDSYGVPMRIEDSAGDSSNQATATSKDKPTPRAADGDPYAKNRYIPCAQGCNSGSVQGKSKRC